MSLERLARELDETARQTGEMAASISYSVHHLGEALKTTNRPRRRGHPEHHHRPCRRRTASNSAVATLPAPCATSLPPIVPSIIPASTRSGPSSAWMNWPCPSCRASPRASITATASFSEATVVRPALGFLSDSAKPRECPRRKSRPSPPRVRRPENHNGRVAMRTVNRRKPFCRVDGWKTGDPVDRPTSCPDARKQTYRRPRRPRRFGSGLRTRLHFASWSRSGSHAGRSARPWRCRG